jgi:4-hydroxy-tetrahydrodipicolinate synthase
MMQKKIKENKALIDFLFCEANPIPLKMALYYMKIISSPELRLPLVSLAADKADQLKMMLRQKGMIS